MKIDVQKSKTRTRTKMPCIDTGTENTAFILVSVVILVPELTIVSVVMLVPVVTIVSVVIIRGRESAYMH